MSIEESSILLDKDYDENLGDYVRIEIGDSVLKIVGIISSANDTLVLNPDVAYMCDQKKQDDNVMLFCVGNKDVLNVLFNPEITNTIDGLLSECNVGKRDSYRRFYTCKSSAWGIYDRASDEIILEITSPVYAKFLVWKLNHKLVTVEELIKAVGPDIEYLHLEATIEDFETYVEMLSLL